jgi:predicted glutamine amidotransferase
MCGIIGAFNIEKNSKEPVNEYIVEQYQDQKSRGSDGFGVIFIQENGSYEVKRATESTKCLLDIYNNPASMIIMHHRIPTSSRNKMLQTHPMAVEDGSLKHKYLIIHNGIIKNATELKAKHEELGFVYTTVAKKTEYLEEFNDSESLAIEIARKIEGQITDIDAIGSASFIGLQIDKKKDKVIKAFFGRNDGNPLNMSRTRGKIRISSEGEGDEVKENTLYSFNLKDFKFKKNAIEIKTSDSFFSKMEREEPKTYRYGRYNYHPANDYGGRRYVVKEDSSIVEASENTYDNPPEEYTDIMDNAETAINDMFEKQELGELITALEEAIVKEDEIFTLDAGTIIRTFARKITKIIDFAQTEMSKAVVKQEELMEQEALKKTEEKKEGKKEGKKEEKKEEVHVGFGNLNKNSSDWDDKDNPHHPHCTCMECHAEKTKEEMDHYEATKTNSQLLI